MHAYLQNVDNMKNEKTIELNQIYNIDCLDGLKQIEENSVDLIITSPPYNLGKSHHTGNHVFDAYVGYEDNMPENEYQKWQTEVLNECYRILKVNGSMFYNHKNRIKNGEQIEPYRWIYNTDFIIKQEIIWQNGSQNFDKCRFYPMTERVYWLVKDRKTKMFNAINHHDLFTRAEWKPVKTKGSFKRAYPDQMVEDIIKCFPESQIVLDPFSGSGTTCYVAKNMNKNFIGFEITPEAYDLSMKRINECV